MDHGKSIEDHFSKLHPCFPINTRIGIIGAGSSGLSAAYALSKLGYSNVTVFEKCQSVGGMCDSVVIEGRIYDLGGQVLAANSAPTIFHLAEEIGAELEEMDTHKFAIIDSFTGEYNDVKVVDDYVSIISLTLDLQDKAEVSGRFGVHALSNIASDLTPEFLKGHGFKSVPKSVAYGYTASGYGFVQDMPYAYVHEFTRTSMAGKIRRFKGGYSSVWQKISDSLPIEVHCNSEVLAIRRNSDDISIYLKNDTGEKQVVELDKIIISGTFPLCSGKTYRSSLSTTEMECELMDMSVLEKELFSKVETIDYYTTVLKIKGLEGIPKGFYYFGEFMDDPAAIGHPVAMQRFYDDTDIFLFWSYGNNAYIRGSKVTELAINAVKRMGGEVEKVVLQRQFKYFPHVNGEDMKNGFYDKMEFELQGQRNTYYVGGLLAFELTERNSSYAMALVCKHFANNGPLPKYPYVKRLFTLQPASNSNQLHELQGLQFPDLSSLDGFLRHWGTHNITQNKTLYTWINEKGEVNDQRTFVELHANASRIAYKILTNQKPVIKSGDRVLLVYTPGLDFIDAFFGCLRARVIPVPAIPPDPSQRGGQALLHINNIAKTCNAVAILSMFDYHTYVRAVSMKNMILLTGKDKYSSYWPDLPWLHTDSWIKKAKSVVHQEGIPEQSEPLPGDLCFLQFTSGSTGNAKGVMITHGGLIHNVKLMRKRYKATSRTVLVSWLPQYHDMGLIGGLFTSLVSGGSAILFSPTTFIKNPLLWLHTMSKYRATHSAGPNFAFELIVRRLESEKYKVQNINLSSMVFLMVAAEPVRAKTLRRFMELTRPFGLSQEVLAPGYGLAENCVYVSSAFGEGKPILVDWQGRVCCGYADPNDPDVDIRIVNPDTGKEHENPEKEGEIWISSLSAGIGYWGMEELSQKTFRNELQNQFGKKYTRTGDLGRIIEGKLFITGRIKDLIIVAGKNVYSSDIEKTIECLSELLRPGCCAVIGVPEDILLAKGIAVPESSDQVGVVVIAEVHDGKAVGKEVIDLIQTRVAEEHGVVIASVVLIRPRTICKTTSGKIKRFECLKQFTDGTLNVIEQPVHTGRLSVSFMRRASHPKVTRNSVSSNPNICRQEIIDFLKRLLSEQTGIGIPNISITESLVSYGVDSIGVVRAAQKLSDFLGVPVGAIDIFTATCIEDLANFAENLLIKTQPHLIAHPISYPTKNKGNSGDLVKEIPMYHKLCIWLFQLLALTYVSMMIIIPAYLSIFAYITLTSASYNLVNVIPWFAYLISLVCAPLAWILCILSTCICIAFFGNSFLQPNYAMTSEIPIWSLDFIKWWALHKAQEVSSKVLAVHLRGTVFLKYWFVMLGARIGTSVLLDTVDITDPSLVSIGDGVVLAEGVLVQSHEVKNGVLSFGPIRIGRDSAVGPYAVIQKGSVVADGTELQALQTSEGSKMQSKTAKSNIVQKGKMVQEIMNKTNEKFVSFYHFLGIYAVASVSSLSAAIAYFILLWLAQKPPSFQHFSFICICGAFHWFPFTIVAYAIMFKSVPASTFQFAIAVSISYLAHGLILCLITAALTHVLSKTEAPSRAHLESWLRHRIIIACHLRFSKFLSGTEALCMYFRLLGAKIGQHCSIRAINPITEPKLISIADGVHLGDFSRIIPGLYTSSGFVRGKIEISDNSVIGSQSLVLPGSVIEKDVILGALSVAPMTSVLQMGGVFVGSKIPVMVKNSMHILDDRLEEMDVKYKKVVGNLAANLAATTLKVRSRFFHRIGAAGKGFFRLYNDIPGLPEHNIFSPGKIYPIIIRHSNGLSYNDDARIDLRGAAIKILSVGGGHDTTPLLDLTLKTGKAFNARTIGDFAMWLVCGNASREEYVKHAPHVREAIWDSLRRAHSYTELHYYSTFCRLFRFKDGQEMYVKFKLRPFNEMIDEDSGKVEPVGILPPETGFIPRDANDSRPLLFLAEDFQSRVSSLDRVRYVLQLQTRPIPKDEGICDTALDCTKPWDETEFPYIDVGEITIDQMLNEEESEKLEFNPFQRCHELDVIRATSCSQSASIDHGRSIVYDICQHLRNRKPLPEAWRVFLEQSDVKLDLSGCPMAAALEKEDTQKVTLARKWYQTLWLILAQPLLQTVLPNFLIGLVIFAPLNWVLYMKETKKLPLHWLLPLFWVYSGILVGLVCVVAKWILVGKKREGDIVQIWSRGIFMDTIWQAIRTLVGDYFMEMTSGSALFGLWMSLMGSRICWDQGVYVDSMGALMNPDMVKIERNGCVGREALLFGHIYEGEGGKVKYGNIGIEEGGFVGTRAVVMPGVTVESGGSLGALSLAMKEEIVK